MAKIDWGETDRFIDGVFRKSRSVHSKRFYSFGVKMLKEYCEERKVRMTQANIYDSLDGYVAWLDAKGLKPKTILDYMSAARRFLIFSGFDLDDKKFRVKVPMPRVTKIPEEPLRMEQMRRILTVGKPNASMRALILLLLSSGMRLAEALQLQVRDLDLKADPARANLKAEVTKGKRARVAYVSDEAREAILEIVKGADGQRNVFPYSGDIWSKTKIATVSFRRVVARSGLDEKIEGHRIHKIHFHLFRKYFLTKGSDVIGEHAAHALCGHGFYMDTYYQKSEEERAADYKRLMPKLTVFGSDEVSRSETLSIFNRQFLKLSRYSDEEIEGMGDLSQLAPEQLQELIDQKNKKSMGVNGNNQKVVGMDELENLVTQGWDFVTTLPNDKAVVKLPS